MSHVDPSAASDSDAACERSEILARKQSALSRYCVEPLEVISGAGTISMRRRCGCGGAVV